MREDTLPAGIPELDALMALYDLDRDAAEKLRRLHDLLVSDPAAPTAIRDPQRVVHDHLADSLVALDLDQVRAAVRAADLGAGAGLPGLALACALPNLELELVESSRRKCDFIWRAVATCGVANASVVCSRAECWQDGLGLMDLVTARALAQPAVVIEYAAPLLRLGGALVMWRGRRDERLEQAAARAARHLGLDPVERRPVAPYPGARHRHLEVLVKARGTPAGFPRRAGMAAKRPLGAPSGMVAKRALGAT